MNGPSPGHGSRRPPRTAVAVVLVTLAVLGGACTPSASGSAPLLAVPSRMPAAASKTAAPLASSAAAVTSPSPSPGRGPTGSTAPLAFVSDPSLAELLPTEADGIHFVRRDRADGGPAPAPFDDGMLQLIRDLAATPSAAVSLAWIEPEAEPVDRTGGIRPVAVRIAGASGASIRDALAVATLLRPGRTGIDRRELGGKSVVVIGDTSVVWSHGDALIAMTFPSDLVSPPSSAPRPTPPPLTFEGFFLALPGSDPRPAPDSLPTPRLPSLHPNASLAPDRAAEALLPATVAGHPLSVISGRGPDILTNQLLGLPAYGLLRSGIELDLTDAGAALGYGSELSSYVVMLTRLPGISRIELLRAWFEAIVGGGGSTDAIEVLDVDGRIVQLYRDGQQAVFAADGLLVFMAYYDVGDFPSESPAPRPALRDLVIDTVRNLPAAVDDGSLRP